MKLIALLTLALTSLCFGQSLRHKNIKFYQVDTLEAAQSGCDHFPFLEMDLSESKTIFLIALCEYDILWKDEFGKPSNSTKKDDKATPPEQINHSFLDLSLTTPDKQELKAIGKFTSDLRLDLIRSPKYAKVEAREEWGATTLRFGALFVVNKADKNFTLNFAGLQNKVEVTAGSPPKPSSYANVQLLETEIFDSKMLDSSRINRSIPDAKLKLSTPSGKLLGVKVQITPTAPNVMGGEYRYIFRPSDFMLDAGQHTLRPIGFIGHGNVNTDSIYNVSRSNLEEFGKTSQELTLIFSISDTFKAGDLLFLNEKKAEVEVK